jgi:Tfp pilus assembly protein PilV
MQHTQHTTPKTASGTFGFTLVETLVAVLVLSFMLVASVSLLSRTIQATSVSEDRFIAVKLVQEGMAIVKAKRNKNRRAGASFDQNLIGTWEVDSTRKGQTAAGISFDVASAPPRTLCRRIAPATEAGKYWYDCTSADAAPLPGDFTRVIVVQPINAYSISVTCTVTWNGGSDSVSASTVMYPLS